MNLSKSTYDFRSKEPYSMLLNYLSESEKEEDNNNLKSMSGNIKISTNLLCPSTFIRLYKSEI